TQKEPRYNRSTICDGQQCKQLDNDKSLHIVAMLFTVKPTQAVRKKARATPTDVRHCEISPGGPAERSPRSWAFNQDS
ncbi:MAG: hypothetical protein KGK01_07680, partial [Bradyrhizobium sp.]|nr:hypothetical protein [Bradyrhizobium sp.]